MGLQEIQNERFENSEYWPKQDSEVLKLGACVLHLGSYAHSGPLSDRAETASLPRRPRPEYPRACCPTPRAPEVGPTRVEEQHHPRPTYGALDHTAELLAKLLPGSEDQM